MRRSWLGLRPCVLPCTLLIPQDLRKFDGGRLMTRRRGVVGEIAETTDSASHDKLERERSERCESDACGCSGVMLPCENTSLGRFFILRFDAADYNTRRAGSSSAQVNPATVVCVPPL